MKGAPAILLVLLAAALYGPRLGHDFVTDDAIYIVENRAVVEGAPLAAYFTDRATVASNPEFQWQSYRPLRTLAFRLVAVIGGVHPVAFGLANLLLYAASALLVLGLGRRLGLPPGGALWGTALWVAAPVHVEPVLYASSLGDHLSLALELGGLWLALDSLGERPRPGRAVAGWLLVAAAMLAKEMAVTAPALLALLAWADGAWRRCPRRTGVTVAVYGVAALLFLIARTAVLGAVGHGATTAAGALAQLAMVPWRLGAYVGIVVAPLGHSAAYVLPSPGPVALAAAWAALAVTTALVLRAAPLVRVGAGWFVLALAPVLGLVPVFADLADRFALVPSVGLAWMAPTAMAAMARRWRPLGVLAPALLLAAHGAGTLVESTAWRDELTLWSKAVALEPRSAQARRNLGLILLQHGQPAAALRHLDEARALGEQAGELDRRRAMALEALGRLAEAEAAAAEAVRRSPERGSAHALHGGLLARRGALPEAERALAEARRLEPDRPSTLLLQIELAIARGDLPRALAAESRLLDRFPREPRFLHRHALTLLRAGRAAEAVTAARACLALAAGHPQCACALGRALAEAGGSAEEARRMMAMGLAALPPGPERAACEDAKERVR